jgi:amino acid adenylation domain-containing protein
MSKLPSTPVTELVALDATGSYALPLSHEQTRLWFLHQSRPLDIHYHMGYRIDLHGQLDVAAFTRALDLLVERHEPLRAHFQTIDGTPYQVIQPTLRVPLPLLRLDGAHSHDEAGLAERLAHLEQAALQHPFDLHAPSSLMRASLIRIAPDRHRLLIVMHHIIGDGWSHAILVRDWCALYRAETEHKPHLRPVALDVQFGDYVLWQRVFLQSEACERQVRYWVEQCQDVAYPVQLACGQTVTTPGPGTLAFALPAALRRRLRQRIDVGSHLLSALLLAPFELLLARFAHQQQFVLGMAMANRPQEALASLIGFFVNTVIMPSDTAYAVTNCELLDRVNQRLIEAQANVGAPLERVLTRLRANTTWRDASLIKVLFVLQNSPQVEFDFSELEVQVGRIPSHTAKFDLTLFATPSVTDPTDVSLEFEYDPSRFPPSFIESLRDSYLKLLGACWCSAPSALADIALCAGEQACVKRGALAPELYAHTLPELFAQQATRTPDAAAMCDEHQVWTYCELHQLVCEYATVLRQHGAARRDIIAVLLPRGPELVVAILGILAAGASYAPIDPAQPALRLQRLWSGLQAQWLICPADVALTPEQPRRLPLPSLLVDSSCDLQFDQETYLGSTAQPSDLAYVIQTSGSTGRAKGVEVMHAGLSNVCIWIAQTLALGPADRCLLKTPLTFDAAARELFPTLISGACLAVTAADTHRDITMLAQWLGRTKATVLHCVPTQLQALLDSAGLPASLRAIMCGGEALSPHTVRRIKALSACRLWNVYGPTETTVDALAFELTSDLDGDCVPIGRPLPNMQVAIVDSRGRPLPFGAVGEICISGIGVACGYRPSQPGPSPFSIGEDGIRSYASGDLGRMTPDGVVEYLGRIDHQIKRHGVRLEPATIEAALLEHPAIAAAHVLLQRDESTRDAEAVATTFSAVRVVAFVTPAPDAPTDAATSTSAGANWRDVFETSYAQMPAAVDVMSNTYGWVARADRAPLPSADIVSAAERASSRVLRWRPRRVLEIGCGTGLLLLRIAPHCKQYDGIDVAASALAYLQPHVEAAGFSHVRLFHGGADFRPPGACTYDAIVVNSVVQYFANSSELAQMLDVWRTYLAPDGVIFVGDVRDARCAELAAWWDQSRMASEDASAIEVKIASDFQRLRDPELCLAPAYFAEWAMEAGDFAPPLIEAKTSSGDNELVHFRYDVTLARCNGKPQPKEYAVTRLGSSTQVRVKRLRDELLLLGSSPPGTTLRQLRKAARKLTPDGETPAQRLTKLEERDNSTAALHWICRSLGNGDRYELISFPDGASPAWLCTAFGVTDYASSALPPGGYARFMEQIEDLPRFLHARLTSYELPDQIVPLVAMPTTAHGKMDTRWLKVAATMQRRLLGERSVTDTPATALETTICEVFTALVGTRFLPTDDFFLLGGHSLLATRAVSRLSRSLQLDVPLRALFDAPSPRQLAVHIERLRADQARHEGSPRTPIAVRSNRAAAELTRAQYRLWFIEQLGTAPGVYHVCHALKLEGELDVGALGRSLADLVARHSTLRSRFPQWLDEPQVVIDPPGSHGCLELVSDLEPISADEALRRLLVSNATGFNLQQDRLLRISLARIVSDAGVSCHLLGIVAHHIIIDGWSMALAIEELFAGYNRHRQGGSVLPPALAVDYYDVAAAQNAALARGQYDQHLQFWWDSLNGAPARLALPYDWPAPAQRSWEGEKLELTIPAALRCRLQGLASSARATDFMLLLAAFEVLLAKLSGAEDFVVGTVIANRHYAEYEPLVGMLVNPLALRASVSPRDTFADLLARVRAQMLSAYEHQDAPFEAVLEAMSVDRRSDYQAGFQVLFAMQNAGRAMPDLHGLRCERLRLPTQRAMFDLSLEVMEEAGQWRLELEFSADLFRKETANRFAQRYVHLLESIAEQPSVALATLPLTTPSERAEIAQWSHGPRPQLPAGPLTVVHLLIDVARRHPDSVAIDDGVRQLSYSTLLAEAQELATRLQAQGLRRGQRVGLHIERSSHIAVASIAVQSLGVAIAYLDPALQRERLHALFEAAGLSLVLSAAPAASLEDLPVLVLPRMAHVVGTNSSDRWWQPAVSGTDVAFVGFTSGSSGPPKAVLVPQHALARRLKANDTVVAPLYAGDRAAHLYTMNYDGGLLTLFWPLCTGATVVMMPLELLGNASDLARALARQRITVLDAIPPVLSDLFGQPWPQGETSSLRLVITGGEACPADLPAKVLAWDDVRFANQYGPCEGVINATTWVTDRRAASQVPNIGRPLPDTDIYIVDRDGSPSAIGMEGEILIGGPALADGYFGAPDLTAAKFIDADPNFEGTPRRVYRTGDLGRWTADGDIEFLGRLDRQVQIRAMRSDPGEVEAILKTCDDVADCHVAVAGEFPAHYFVAYVVPRDLTQGAAQLAELAHDPTHLQRLHDWEGLFESIYHPDFSRPAGPGMDFMGWNDSATGEPIDPAEMQAWLNATLANVRAWPFPERPHVLEIGAGAGLVALAMARDAASYLATDISARALARLQQLASALPPSCLECRLLSATDLAQLGERQFDLIILNSVVQYFPSADYLRAVLADCAAKLRPGGRVFLGDVRDTRLARRCHQEIAQRRYGGHLEPERLACLSVEAELLDEELNIAPEFFSALTAGAFGTWQPVPMLKLDAGSSEMVRYRYDVWLTLEPPFTDTVAENPVMVTPGARLPELEQYLRAAHSQALPWCAIPNARLRSTDDVADSSHPSDATELRVSRVHRRVESDRQTLATDPDRVSELARELGRMVIAQPSASGRADHFDAIFLPHGATLAEAWPSLCWQRAQNAGPLHNMPLLGRRAPGLRTTVAAYAIQHLPQHLCPGRYIIVNHVPRGPGAQRELALLAATGTSPNLDDRCSASDLRLAAMEDIWSELLMTDVSGPEADFFALGGHSLLAARLAAIIKREFGIGFPVLKVFSLRTLGAVLAEVIRLRSGLHHSADQVSPPAPLPDWHAQRDSAPELTSWQRHLCSALAEVPRTWPRHLGFSVEMARLVAGSTLAEAWQAVQEQHPILQRRYDERGRPAARPTTSPLEQLTLSGTTLAEWVHKPMQTDCCAPMELAWLRGVSGPPRLAVKAHPAFIDADSILIAMRDLALAERALRESQVPFAGVARTDFANLVTWERLHAAKPINAARINQQRHRGTDRPAVVELSWTEAQFEALARVARNTGVSVCAVLLGALGMQIFAGRQGGTVACPVSLRDALAARGVLGPFAIDVPLGMDAAHLHCLAHAALMAADQICTLLDAPSQMLSTSAQQSSTRWAFNYQDRFAATDGRAWEQLTGLTRAHELHVVPQWYDFKVSALRAGTRLRMRLSADSTLLPAAESLALLERLRACVLKEAAGC